MIHHRADGDNNLHGCGCPLCYGILPEDIARLNATIANLQRRLRNHEETAATAMRIMIEGRPGAAQNAVREDYPQMAAAFDAYVQERVDRERREVSDWIDVYAKSEGLTITLETKTTEERIRALCTLLSAKAAHEKDRAVLAESAAIVSVVDAVPFRCHSAEDIEFHSGCVQTREGIIVALRKRLAANRAKVGDEKS